jgi:hypothetical protein
MLEFSYAEDVPIFTFRERGVVKRVVLSNKDVCGLSLRDGCVLRT